MKPLHLIHRLSVRPAVILMASVLFCVNMSLSAAGTLFSGGKSRYRIVLSDAASTSEQTAAAELQRYIREISGAELPILTDLHVKGPRVFVGYNDRVGELLGQKDIGSLDETFTYESRGKDIFIYGGSQRGTLYGVYTFLENELGCRWYTPTYTKVPKVAKWRFKKLSHSESPAIKYRYSNYYEVANADEWCAHNKQNYSWNASTNKYGNLEAYWSCHTMGLFVPEEEFFPTHPEYFALRGGQRKGSGQLCLSNPDVMKICRDRLLAVMDKEPLYRIYSLSQKDNYEFCECDECKKIEERYGGHSGLILWFVNQVADEVGKVHPDKYVGTFAYQYGRKPPVGIVPRDNVVIRLCNIECCFAHPMDAGCPQNESFMADLQGWKEIAPHLFIWDYIVDYAQYLAPWPNFQVLGPNIKVFRDYNAIGIFEEAQYQSLASEFQEMKTWVVTKLLWNPEQDVNVLVEDFIEGFYGKAAPKVLEYYYLCQSLVTPDHHYGIFIGEQDPLYNDEFVRQGEAILREAMNLAEDDEIKERTGEVLMQILYLKTMRAKQQSFNDGTWDELVTMMRHYQTRANEWGTLETFIKNMENERK